MAQPLTTVSQQVTVNVSIYFNLILDSKVTDPELKALLKGMSGLVISIVGLLIASAESGGKVSKAECIRFAVSHMNSAFQLVDQDKLNCATALVDLALTAEAGFATAALSVGVNAIPIAGNTTYILLLVYNACAVVAAALTVDQSCNPKVASLQWIDVRAGQYMTRAAIA
jgi:hypothetical protein